jgi:hypothetical protein
MADARSPGPHVPPGAATTRDLAKATGGALALAAVVLVLAVLPAEYGVDPTGFGQATGLTRLRASPAAGLEEPTSALWPRPLYEASARWTLEEHFVAEFDGLATTHEDVVLPFNLTLANLTAVHAVATWTPEPAPGPGAEPPQLQVSLRSPLRRFSAFGSSVPGTGGASVASTTHAVAPVPFPPEPTPGQPLVLEAPPSREGAQGTWAVVVRMPPPDRPEAERPLARFVVRVTAEAYALSWEVADLGREPWDAVRITLRPGQHLEYKFEMEEGDTMRYAWNATGPLASDLHGEHPGSRYEATSHRSLAGTSDAGTFVAPFTGRHGWFWRNAGSEVVEVTLRTRGEYRILGVA